MAAGIASQPVVGTRNSFEPEVSFTARRDYGPRPSGAITKKLILVFIRVSRRLFYNSRIHRSRIVNVIYSRLFHAAYPPGDILDVECQGHVFGVPTHDISILPSLLNGDYENYEFEVMRSVARPGLVFADVGANIGLFTVVIAASVGTTGHVYAFEPEPVNFAQLERNVARNRLTNVTAEQLAIGAAPSILTLHVKAGSIGTHTLLAGPKTEAEQEISVEVKDLDSYFRRQERWPELVKVDVEGFEPRVFEGAHEVFRRCQYLFFEYARTTIERQGLETVDFASMLSAFPYLYRIDETAHRLRAITGTDFTKIFYANLVAAKRPLTG
jgi:FkbM family methyltransferase